MTMNPEHVLIMAGGSPFTDWERVSVRAAMNEAARTFEMQTVEGNIARFNFPPGTEIEISANGSLVCKGFVNVYAPSIDQNSHTVKISGRSRAQDYVDSSAEHDTGNFENMTPDQIGQALDRYGTGIVSRVALEAIPRFQIHQGETAFSALERATRDQGVTIMGLADGSLELTNASVAERHGGGLIEGFNIIKAEGQLSDANRFRTTRVRGQSQTGNEDTDLQIDEEAEDSGVTRNRTRIIVNETDTQPGRARRRARNDSRRAQGAGTKCTITVQGWRDDGGLLWKPNTLVMVESPSLKIMGDMLIESVAWSQGSGGSTSVLSLVDPVAYNGQRGRANQTDPSWSAPALDPHAT